MRDHGQMIPGPPTTAIVLAGGASHRMGSDKRLLEIDGTAMLRRAVEALSDAGQVLVVIDPAHPLPPELLGAAAVHVVPDLRHDAGPLAGLEAGLTAAEHDAVLVVAADMPWLEPAILDLLVERLEASPAASVVCLGNDRGPQPLPMTCRRAPVLAQVTALLDNGERRLRAVLGATATTTIGEPEWRRLDPPGRSLMDIDTPADLARVG